MVNVVPKDIFKEVCDSIKTEVSVTANQVGAITYLYFDTSGLNINNYIKVNCGEMNGMYRIHEIYSNRVGIQYTGAVENGTVKTIPFFQWGNLKEGKISIHSLNEFPLIYLMLPTPYDLNINMSDMQFITSSFQFLIIDRTSRNTGSRTETDFIYDNVVSEMSDLALEFSQGINKHKRILNNATFRRSEEIPFGVTFSGESGSDETLIEDAAGCYLEARVQISKKQC